MTVNFRRLPRQRDDRQIAATIIAMSHTRRLKVPAEGGETEEQLNFLKEQGCDFYQGYFKSPAIPAEAFFSLRQRAC